MVQEGFPEEVTFGPRAREGERGRHLKSGRRAFQRKTAARAKAPRERQGCCVLGTVNRQFIYLRRTQSSRPRDRKGDPAPAWPLEPLPTGHQRAAVLFPFWLSGVFAPRTLEERLML